MAELVAVERETPSLYPPLGTNPVGLLILPFPNSRKQKSKSNEHSLEQCHDCPLPVICFGEDERAGAVEYLREREWWSAVSV